MADFKAEPVDPVLARKLDAFTVPPLPSGFAARVAAVAADLPQEAPYTPVLPRARRAAPRRRWRVAATGLGAVALGMMSISAAAMGYLGEPLRGAIQTAPVVGPVLVKAIARVAPERVDPEALPAPKPVLAGKVAAPAANLAVEAKQPDLDDLPPRLRLREERRRIMADPEARRSWLEAHPRAARRIAERQEARRAWIEAHPVAAQRLAERRAARQALIEERRAQGEPGLAPPPSAEFREGAPELVGPRGRPLWRERLRERRELRRELRRARIEEQRAAESESEAPVAAPEPEVPGTQ